MVATKSSWIVAASGLALLAQQGSAFTATPARALAKSAAATRAAPLAVASDTAYDIVKVDLTDGRDYPIYIGSDFSDAEASDLLTSHVHGKRVLIITNDRVGPLHLEHYKSLFDKEGIQVDEVVLPDGEDNKTFDVMATILDKALELKLDRKATFVALGGGVIGDMVGFAAAIYQRGVNFIQIPTSVMAMVDSSVGGKTAVNHPRGKNMIGAFYQPQCVFIDTTILDTLPDRELKSGLSEVVKYGLIRDAPFFKWQEEHMSELLARNPQTFREAIKRSCENKAEVVKADEREGGVRATLNLGHTFGHAIETGSGYGTFLHGEGVSMGTAMAATMSEKMGWIDADLKARIYKILEDADLPVALPSDSPMTVDMFNDLMSLDKKVADGQLRLILLEGPLGGCKFTGEFDVDAMQETIEEFVAAIKGDVAP